MRRDEAGWLFVPLCVVPGHMDVAQEKRCRLTLEADAVLACGRRSLNDDALRNRNRCLRPVSGSGRLSASGVPLGIPWFAPLPFAGTNMQWDVCRPGHAPVRYYDPTIALTVGALMGYDVCQSGMCMCDAGMMPDCAAMFGGMD
eukprot:gene7914-1348_t